LVHVPFLGTSPFVTGPISGIYQPPSHA